MIRRPPRSPLFPYTTLSRSQAPLIHPPQFSSKLRVNIISQDEMTVRVTDEIRGLAQKTKTVHDSQVSNQNETKNLQRSEEHTSELQSPCNLVCRLLLEKKKT